MSIPEAISWKYPGAKCSKNAAGDGIDSWTPPPNQPDLKKPNTLELFQILQDYQARVKSTEYVRLRKKEYPQIANQLDAIYKTLVFLQENGTALGPDGESFVQQIKAVKNKYPKPV